MRKNKRKVYPPDDRILVIAEDYDSLPDLCDGGATAAIIGAGLSAAAAGTSAALQAGSKWGSKTYMRVAKEMAQYNTKLNEDIYNKYQSPSALMRQYKEAGLNPNLIYQQSTSGAGNVSAGQVSTNPNDYNGDRTRYADAFQQAANVYSVYQDIMQRNSNINNTDAVTENTKAEQQYKQLQSEHQKIQNQYVSDMMRSQLEGLATDNAMKAIKLNNDRIFSESERRVGLLKSREELANVRMDTTKKSKEIAKIDGEIGQIDQNIKESKARVRTMEENVRLGFGNLAVAQRNAATNWYNAQTGRFNYGLSSDQFTFNKTMANKNFDLESQKFQFNQRYNMMNQILQYGMPTGSWTSAQPWNAMKNQKALINQLPQLYNLK